MCQRKIKLKQHNLDRETVPVQFKQSKKRQEINHPKKPQLKNNK